MTSSRARMKERTAPSDMDADEERRRKRMRAKRIRLKALELLVEKTAQDQSSGCFQAHKEAWCH